jgi:AraC-like DNA-binding protein
VITTVGAAIRRAAIGAVRRPGAATARGRAAISAMRRPRASTSRGGAAAKAARAPRTATSGGGTAAGTGDESLPRILKFASSGQRSAMLFVTGPGQTYLSGLELSQNDIIAWGLGSPRHLRSSAAIRWGVISLPEQDLVAVGSAIIGRELHAPSFAHRISPPAPLLSRLRNLHEAAGHLAKTAPDILAKPEVARAMEQALVEAMVSCLASGNPVDQRSAYRHHTRVMQRLEQALQADTEGPLYMAELSAAVGVSYRTLHDCCREHLGMSPKRYLWLRRMNLARRALRRADPERTSVTEIATNYGFWEWGASRWPTARCLGNRLRPRCVGRPRIRNPAKSSGRPNNLPNLHSLRDPADPPSGSSTSFGRRDVRWEVWLSSL